MTRFSITGGAGFIGSALVRRLVEQPDHQVQTIDNLSYAGNRANLGSALAAANHQLDVIDICDQAQLSRALHDFAPEVIFHLAAESHVDRSIEKPAQFLATNIQGTYNILQTACELTERYGTRVVHVSTDEVYGSLGSDGLFSESSAYQPNSPYAASKAAADHLARAWQHTYDLPVIVTNCSNNYGPYQFPEKLIPVTIFRALGGLSIDIYGDGLQVRDWLYVEDHVTALLQVAQSGQVGESYNVGGNSERTNREVVAAIIAALAGLGFSDVATMTRQINYVQDRPGHDRRYAIDASKIAAELGWQPEYDFDTAMQATVAWYVNNQAWVTHVMQGYGGERLGLQQTAEAGA